MRIITRLLALNAAWSLVPPATTRRHLAAAPAATAAGAREIVLISGFESFNCALYEKCAHLLSSSKLSFTRHSRA